MNGKKNKIINSLMCIVNKVERNVEQHNCGTWNGMWNIHLKSEQPNSQWKVDIEE